MSLLTASGVGQSFGGFDVFTNISLSIPNDAKIGLVGPNGIGKTSLLQILAGMAKPTSGSVHRAREARLGYLRQEAVEAFRAREHSVYAEMLTVFDEVQRQASILSELEARMAHDHGEETFARYAEAQEAFERAGGYEYELRIARVLEGLGFAKESWEMPLSQLSGGQKTRVLLARLLLEAPDILILDEPTNHLDVQTVEWLEATLRGWPGALLIVSHDRYFLDRVVDRIYEMARTHLETYRGNYTAYLAQRQERWERRRLVYEAEKERLEKEIDYIRRHIAGQRTDMAKGKLKRLSRELVAIEEHGLEAAVGMTWSETGIGGVSVMGVEEAARRIRSIPAPDGRPPTLALHLKSSGRSGTIVLRTRSLEIGYPGKPLFAADDIELRRQECAALIGPNGAGKTTFLRTVLGQLTPLVGEATLGASLKVGYFAQAHEALDRERTVIEELRARREMDEGAARNYLAAYLFRGDDVWKRVGALSGGERGRLALALLALDGANFLLLDEPTNHLDIPAQEVLQEGLEQFGGTLLLVSHDRYLVDRLATQIWEIDAGRLRVFPGPYQEYLGARAAELARAREQRAVGTQAAGAVAAQSIRRPEPRPEAALAATGGDGGGITAPVNAREARKRAQTVAGLEREIGQLEQLLARYEQQLQEESEAQRFEEVRRLAATYSSTQAQLDELLANWATLAE